VYRQERKEIIARYASSRFDDFIIRAKIEW